MAGVLFGRRACPQLQVSRPARCHRACTGLSIHSPPLRWSLSSIRSRQGGSYTPYVGAGRLPGRRQHSHLPLRCHSTVPPSRHSASPPPSCQCSGPLELSPVLHSHCYFQKSDPREDSQSGKSLKGREWLRFVG